jgi:head-tail adaptor
MPFNGLNSLTYQIVIQTQTVNNTTHAVSLSNSSPVWASVESRFVGPEIGQSGGIVAQADYVLRIPSRFTVTATNLIAWNGKTLQVHAVRPVDRAYTEVYARERQ